MNQPVQPLIDSLFRVALARLEQPLPATIRVGLEAASPDAWNEATRALERHRMLPLLHSQLTRFGVLDLAPPAVRDDLQRAHDEVRILNMLLILSTATLLRELAQRGETPLLMKGVVLAEGYYADFAARPMGDIDVVAAPGRDALLLEVLDGLGYTPIDAPPEADAVVLKSASGLVCDAHRRLRLFAHEPWQELTRQTELSRLRGLKVRVFVPNAMVAHAIAHMAGHMHDLGPMLLWIVDVAVIMRRHSQELSAVHVLRLLREPQMRTLLLRVLSLLLQHGEVLPTDFAEACRGVPALSLAAILRQRRLTPWGLPAPIGWVRLCAQRLSLREYERCELPELEDLLMWPMDELAQRMLSHLVGRSAA